MPLIVLEGIDGSGKSSVARELHAVLTQKFGEGKVLPSIHPFASQLGSWVRNILETGTYHNTPAEYHLVVSAHADTWNTFLIRELQAGKWCILDRGLLSVMTYQRDCFPFETDTEFADRTYLAYTRYARHFAFMSHTMKLLIDVDVNTALYRIAKRGGDALDGDGTKLLRLANQYAVSALEYERASGNPVVRVNGNNDLRVTTRLCLREISRRFFGDSEELIRGSK